MSYKYSLAHLTTLGIAPPEMIYTAATAGYDYVSIRPIHMGLPGEPNYALADNKEMYLQTKRALQSTGIGVHDIELAKIEDGREIKDYEAAIEIGAELGAKAIISSVWTADKSSYTEKFSELCDLANKYGLKVALEFVTFAEVRNLQQAKELLAAVDKANAGYLIDTLHFSRSRVNVEELNDIPQEQFIFTHLCDGPAEIPAMDDKAALIHTARDERLYAGEGGIDIASILEKMPKDNVLSIELPHIARAKELGYGELARRSLVTAKEYLAEKGLLG